MRTEPVLILAGFAATLATAVNGLILAFWQDLDDLQTGAICSAVTVVFALGAALLARGRVYSPQTVEGVGPPVARMAAAAVRDAGVDAGTTAGFDGRSEHEKLAALDQPPPPPELEGGTLIGFPSAKARPRTRA